MRSLPLVIVLLIITAKTWAAANTSNPEQTKSAATEGVWKWTTPGRNGQPEESVLKLTTAVGGVVTGTLTNRSGVHPVINVAIRGNKVEFVVERDTPTGKVPLAHTLTQDGTTAKIVVERPNPTAKGRNAGKSRKFETDAFKLPEEAMTPQK